MTNSAISEDEKTDDSEREAAADEAETEPVADDDARPKRSPKLLLRPNSPKRWGAAVLVAAVLAGGVFGFVKYR